MLCPAGCVMSFSYQPVTMTVTMPLPVSRPKKEELSASHFFSVNLSFDSWWRSSAGLDFQARIFELTKVGPDTLRPVLQELWEAASTPHE